GSYLEGTWREKHAVQKNVLNGLPEPKMAGLTPSLGVQKTDKRCPCALLLFCLCFETVNGLTRE
ncbi:MAG TPA: hypothetical protein VFV38_52310, partial [Ktedonobacteraceae bacterium]|nr:hypothetical protein [Ktedonobacteraceae bacterium]